MRRRTALLGLPLILLVTACAGTGTGDGAAQPASPTTKVPNGAFERRAAAIATAWTAALGRTKWKDGFVPLQDLTVLPGDPRFTEETKQAFAAGWYRTVAGALTTAAPGEGTVRFADGSTMLVPLVSAAQAYQVLDQGDAPPCTRPAAAPPPAGTAPDAAVSQNEPVSCTNLLVTKASPGTVKLRTSRGEATVPAWLFTVRELGTPVARVAVAPSAVSPIPTTDPVRVPTGEGIVSAVDLTTVSGTTLGFRLAVGACDKDITPLVYETDDVVVVAGSVVRPDGVCTEQILYHPVTVTLRAPLGWRPVLDAGSGQPLILTVE